MGGVALREADVSRATLGRIPTYLKYLKSLPPHRKNISATAISKDLGLGEVQVRKDLGTLRGSGKHKIGYLTEELISSLERFLCSKNGGTVIIGAGKLGRALLDYGVFSDYGLDIMAAFDIKVTEEEKSASGKRILPVHDFPDFCKNHDVKIGIIAVPPESAQEVCNLLYENGVKAMWCFAPCQLYKPADAIIQYENMALSLAHLKMQIK